MAHPNALNDTPQTVQAGVPQARNPTTPGDLPQPRPLRSATITINGATQTFPPDIAEPQRKILTALGINMAY